MLLDSNTDSTALILMKTNSSGEQTQNFTSWLSREIKQIGVPMLPFFSSKENLRSEFEFSQSRFPLLNVADQSILIQNTNTTE